ncbi:hypothetical protein IMG5_117560 [Ichthyophthirius multifiliis]|uniref:Uncharacterized protein n=1 Tax=Ichthyophthirius multifiliis TaxID=5932 RepID=G0QUJ3_ICHMU|nr:hypothetical protein IMG5_117560 [Ichthyophthirius multifiliis]EGR31113.1 hypothetical protein IMG5_117560 [Ichthyophthirius multifiliis]|eukprot:XP_004034599.1 hypothetical protein IMG5_117560 [Ichthyophthirius multifiliis]
MALLKEDDQFTHIIAIDFGTGASGYGIAPKFLDQDGKSRIEVFNPCDDSDDQKTPSAILFDNNMKFIDFGSSAIQKYAEILEDGDTALFFQNYKINLLHLNTYAKSIDGREMPLVILISETLRFIAEQALAKLKDQVGKIVSSKIRWIITVPALWSEEHKFFMRKAAVEAQIIESLHSSNLLLCLEPEGASIQCREDAEQQLKEQMKKNSVIMVLDCGGGTIDITVHKLLCEVHEKFLCQEIIPSSGGCEWGSKYVELYFEEFLKDFLGSELYRVYQKNALARLDILKDFEILKRKFKGNNNERSMIKLSYLGSDLSSGQLNKLVKIHNEKHPPEFNVEQLIKQTEAKGEHVNFIFMVGGFSESPFLKQIIKQKFESAQVQVLVPRRPQISVIRGACLYGLNPRSISSRIAKKTYGINTLTTFDSEKHPEDKKVIIEGEEFCEDVFDAFVRKGDSVGSQEVHTKIYCPVRSRQIVMRIIFYVTEKRDVNFVDEEGVKQLGELCVDLGKPFQSVEDKTVKVTLLFGQTHIYATATNKDGTEIKNCEFKFECGN